MLPAKRSLFSILYGRRSNEDKKQLLDFCDLLERLLEYDPEKRIRPMEAIKHRFFFNGGMKTYAVSNRGSGGSNSARTSLEPGACSLLQSNCSHKNPLSSARGLSAQRSLEHNAPDLRVEVSS